MTVTELKKYIYENNKIEYILKSIGCNHIKYHSQKDYYSCSNYNGDNPDAINVKNNEYLSVINWTRGNEFQDKSDLITLVQYNKNISFLEAVKYIHKILDLEYRKQKKLIKPKSFDDPLSIFKKVESKNRIDVDEINYIEENILNDYIPLLHINWFKEGIMPWTAKKFGLAYSYKRRRIIIPMRYWQTGELLGINSRTTVENYKELGIKKFYITPSYQKGINLFGLYENYEAIQQAGMVVVVEAEKSVLKRDSLNDSSLVALSGHSMTNEQVAILIGLNVEIVIALDKDISIEEVRHMCEKFYGIRKVSYIFDKWELLGQKDSPADATNKVYNFLMKYRKIYDEKEHKEYIKDLRKKV